MHLQAIVAVAAALLAASANSLPYSNPQTHFASSFPAASSVSLASAGGRPPSTRSPNGAMSALISLVRRQSKQRPMMTASARRALKGKKRSSTCGLTTGNTTVGTDGSATAGNTDVGNNGTISVGVGDGNSTNKANMVTVGYWADWTSGQLAPENIAWAKYDIINYAFAIPQSDSTVQINDASMLKRMVAAAHKNGSKLVLSIGGAGQSGGYINSVASDSAIAKFITNLVALQKQYNLDGFDFDWECAWRALMKGSDDGGADWYSSLLAQTPTTCSLVDKLVDKARTQRTSRRSWSVYGRRFPRKSSCRPLCPCRFGRDPTVNQWEALPVRLRLSTTSC